MEYERAKELHKLIWNEVVKVYEVINVYEPDSRIGQIKSWAVDRLVREGKITKDERVELQWMSHCPACAMANEFGYLCVSGQCPIKAFSDYEDGFGCQFSPRNPYRLLWLWKDMTKEKFEKLAKKVAELEWYSEEDWKKRLKKYEPKVC